MRYAILNEQGTIINFTTDPTLGDVDVTGLKIAELTSELDILKARKLSDIIKENQLLVDEINSKYTTYELESFADQRLEWRTWRINNSASTPIVDILAEARGISKDQLMEKIAEKITFIGNIQGAQNKLEDEVKACNTVEEINAL